MPLDAQETALTPGQEVASPVLTMVHSPGSVFTNSIKVTLPVNSRIDTWYAAELQAQALAALGGRRTAGTPVDKTDRHDSDTDLQVGSYDTSQGRQASRQEIVDARADKSSWRGGEEWLKRSDGDAMVSYFGQRGNTWKSDTEDYELVHDMYVDEVKHDGWSKNVRRDGEDAATYTSLVLHWFNSDTLKWTPTRRGSAIGGNLMSELPPDVLNNRAFSGKVANLLVTTTDPADMPVCGEFHDLIAGGHCVCVCVFT
jgi:hypothetical protein